jgi:DNA-binding phage protein
VAENEMDTGGEWERLRAELLADPENREIYDRTLREAIVLRAILQQVEEARESAGLSKAELAQRVGMNPASLRRLLTSETGNPTFKTMLSVFDALGLEVTLKSTKSSKRRERSRRDQPSERLAVR